MPLKDSTETKMGCQERRGVVGVGGSPRVPHLRSLGKRIKLALANSLMYYLPSTLCAKGGKRKGRKIHGPTPSSPPRRNYEITPRAPSASRGHGPTIEPCSISGRH
ncbi:unnamed protein product [Striga asiatica]|uniref:Uncharacterized protein n=1 Tax=Striga asiatica TaxID=4170 RepID=A0A5A7RGV2_STRAF|nr:unnamed protein product [Striga asiatica]